MSQKHSIDLSIFELKGYLMARENYFLQVAAVKNDNGRFVFRVLDWGMKPVDPEVVKAIFAEDDDVL